MDCAVFGYRMSTDQTDAPSRSWAADAIEHATGVSLLPLTLAEQFPVSLIATPGSALKTINDSTHIRDVLNDPTFAEFDSPPCYSKWSHYAHNGAPDLAACEVGSEVD